jgi:hypothetical protein
MTRTLDCQNKLSLMLGTRSGDPFGNNLSLFIHAALQSLLILVVNVDVLAVTESACTLFALLLIFPLWPLRPV